MPLPNCECNAGLPVQQQLANIYCALYTLAQGGEGVTYPLSPTLGGTGVANAAGETITLNGGFPLQLTLTGATNVTLPTSGTIQIFNQSLNTGDEPTFLNLSTGTVTCSEVDTGVVNCSGPVSGSTINAMDIVANGLNTLNIANGVAFGVTSGWTLSNSNNDGTTLDSNSQTPPGLNVGPTSVNYYGQNGANILGDPDGWILLTVGAALRKIPYFNA